MGDGVTGVLTPSENERLWGRMRRKKECVRRQVMLERCVAGWAQTSPPCAPLEAPTSMSNRTEAL